MLFSKTFNFFKLPVTRTSWLISTWSFIQATTLTLNQIITGVAEAQQENIHRGQPRSQGPLWFVGLRDASVTRRQISRIKLSRPTLADSKMAAQFYIQTRQVSIKLRFKLLFSISCESSDGNALENYFNL